MSILNVNLPALPKVPQMGDLLIPVRPLVLPQLPPIPDQAAHPAYQGLNIPPVMPRLPNVPPPSPWVATKNPSASLVQKHYIETRQEELEAYRLPGRKVAIAILEKMLRAMLPPQNRDQPIPFKELWRVYKEIERNLQSAELTVNFKADAWFTVPNNFDTYTQMYQRAREGGRMVLRDTEVNQADTRAFVDNEVTFPKSWQNQDERTPKRGLRPGIQNPQRIREQMDTGNLVPIHNEGELPAYLAGNAHFNPDTKQVFLALNYGRRPHGSSCNYGYSYFVAKSDLKPNCFYYAQDTFYRAEKGADAGAIQVPYTSLGSLLEANGDHHLRDAIFASCYQGKQLEDEVKTLCKDFLVEAHHFGDLSFHEHVEYMVLSPKQHYAEPLTSKPALWATIVGNAKVFCHRNNIKLYITD